MKTQIETKKLESTGYIRIFECVKDNGIKPIMHLLKEIRDLSKNTIINRAILDGTHETLSIVQTKEYINTIKYLRLYKSDLEGLSLNNESILKALKKLKTDISKLDTYIENAKKLEELKIERIKLLLSSEIYSRQFICRIYRDNSFPINITHINKYYTDGEILYLTPETKSGTYLGNPSQITFKIGPRELRDASFVINCENHENGNQERTIELTSFDFNTELLPTEENIRSYRIPNELTLQK